MTGGSVTASCPHYWLDFPDELSLLDVDGSYIPGQHCLSCDSNRTSDHGNHVDSMRDDATIGYCFDCGTQWCWDCGYVFDADEKDMPCPHHQICAGCLQKQGPPASDCRVPLEHQSIESVEGAWYIGRYESYLSDETETEYPCPWEYVMDCPKIRRLMGGLE
jgi:hypothetical protein